jgi:hypothetical protein
MKYSVYASKSGTILGKTISPADVNNFKMTAVSNRAELKWDKSIDLDVVNGGTYIIKYGATGVNNWNTFITIATLPGYSTSYSAPLINGTYLIKAVDSSGNTSINTVSISSDIKSILDKNVVYTADQHPAWMGTINTMNGELRIAPLDSSYPDGGLILENSSYLAFPHNFSWGSNTDPWIDLGSVFNVEATVLIDASYEIHDINFDAAPGSFEDRTGVFDIKDPFQEDLVETYIATTELDPTLSYGWSSYAKLSVPGLYRGRAFKFKVEISVQDLADTLRITKMTTTIDMPDTIKRGINEITDSSLGNKVIIYDSPFSITPSVGITATSSGGTTFYQITDSTASGFTITFYDTNNPTSKKANQSFNWISSGY